MSKIKKTEERVEEINIVAILENGDCVEIVCKEDIWSDEVYECFSNAVRRGDLFNLEGWCDLKMLYKGFPVGVLNCRKVIGWN